MPNYIEINEGTPRREIINLDCVMWIRLIEYDDRAGVEFCFGEDLFSVADCETFQEAERVYSRYQHLMI